MYRMQRATVDFEEVSPTEEPIGPKRSPATQFRRKLSKEEHIHKYSFLEKPEFVDTE